MSQSEDTSGEETDYEYNGNLVFNGVFRTTPSENSIAREELLEEFRNTLRPRYEDSGVPGNTEEGYSDINLEKYAKKSKSVGEDLTTILESVIDQKYTKENYDGQGDIPNANIVDEQGDPTDAYVQRIYTTDIFWKVPDLLIMRASNSDVEELRSEVMKPVRDSGYEIEPIEFDVDFIMWLIYQYAEGNDLGNDISILSWVEGKATGQKDRTGGINKTEESSDLLSSAPFLIAVLHGKKPTMVRGKFNLRGNEIEAKIYNQREIGNKTDNRGKVQVMAQEDLKQSDDIRRIMISIDFLVELVDLYEDWENMDNNQKYIPPDFIEELADQAERAGASPEMDYEELTEYYHEMRNSDSD